MDVNLARLTSNINLVVHNCQCCKWSPDGKYLVVLTRASISMYDKRIITVYDSGTKAIINVIENGFDHPIKKTDLKITCDNIVFVDNEHLLFRSMSSQCLEIVNVLTGENDMKISDEFKLSEVTIDFDYNTENKLLVKLCNTVDYTNLKRMEVYTLRLNDDKTFDLTLIWNFDVDNERVTQTSFSHDGKMIAVVDKAGIVKIANVKKKQFIREFYINVVLQSDFFTVKWSDNDQHITLGDHHTFNVDTGSIDWIYGSEIYTSQSTIDPKVSIIVENVQARRDYKYCWMNIRRSLGTDLSSKWNIERLAFVPCAKYCSSYDTTWSPDGNQLVLRTDDAIARCITIKPWKDTNNCLFSDFFRLHVFYIVCMFQMGHFDELPIEMLLEIISYLCHQFIDSC